MKWKIIVALVCITILLSYGVVFQTGLLEPRLFSLPYLLWTGMTATIVLVILTYLGSKFFPHNEK